MSASAAHTDRMTRLRRDDGTPGGRLHLRHRWQERSRGKDDRWQECRDCGNKRPFRELLGLKFYLP